MPVVNTDGFSFDFTDARDAFVFDETDKTKPTYHGQPMKAVDIVVELDREYVFVEIKDFHNLDRYKVELKQDGGAEDKRAAFNGLKNYLKYKYRDSYLYRHAEGKANRPIYYICLLANFDNALNTHMRKELKRELPVGQASPRWQKAIVKSCTVVNEQKWNDNFPKWPVTRI